MFRIILKTKLSDEDIVKKNFETLAQSARLLANRARDLAQLATVYAQSTSIRTDGRKRYNHAIPVYVHAPYCELLLSVIEILSSFTCNYFRDNS